MDIQKVVLAFALSAVSMAAGMPEFLPFELGTMGLWISFISATAVIVFFGRHFITSIPKIFVRSDMNTLIGISIVASFTLSLYSWVYGNQELYFDSAAFIASFVLLGQLFEGRALSKIRAHLKRLQGLLPETARRLKNSEEESADGALGGVESISLSEIRKGDVLLVASGERLTADGKLLTDAMVDLSVLTGESRPQALSQGNDLSQGALNVGQAFKVEVTELVDNSFHNLLVAKVEESLRNKPKIQLTMDRVAHIFVPFVVCFAAAIFLYWWNQTALISKAYVHALTVLVIACPCALGMAVPLAFLTGVLRANRKGLLIRSLEAVHKAGAIDIIAFDKTGTLTKGTPSVTRFKAAENISHRDLLQWAASMEAEAQHPYAKAILERAEAEGISLLKAKSLHVEPGKGVSGTLMIDGKEVKGVLGSLTWLFENGFDSTKVPPDFVWAAEGTHETILWLGLDEKFLGLVMLDDALRPETKEVIHGLSSQGFQVGMITGDSENVARALSKSLSLKFYHAGVLPEEKATIVKRLSAPKKKGIDMIAEEICFVGDGLNDAPALAAARLSVAMGSGTAISQSAADIILVSNDLRSVPALFAVTKKIRSLIYQNLSLSFLYNLAALPLASGLLLRWVPIDVNPHVAAVAMGLSSISVALNSLRVLVAKD